MIPSFVVLTAATPGHPWDALADYAHRNHAAFAARFGGQALRGQFPADHARPPSWHKLPCIAAIAPAVPVIWMDADCLFTDAATPDQILASQDKFRMASDCNGHNCGIMSFPAQAWVRYKLEHWWCLAIPGEIHHPWWEQSTLHRLASDWQRYIGPPLAAHQFLHAAGVPALAKLAWLQDRDRFTARGAA
jgi:hypothetical protein